MSAVGYRLWRMHPDGSVTQCAKFALDALESGVIRHFKFQYVNGSESLDPGLFPKQMNPFQFNPESRDLPGILDDLLPDRWGRAVIARYYALQGEVFRPSSTLDILNRLSDSSIGALRVQRVHPDQSDEPSGFAFGSPLEKLNLLLQPQNRIDSVPPENLQGLGLQLLLGGSSVGGARPKVLTYDKTGAYIAKFSRHDDPFDMVSVEHACLRLAEAAGARVAASSICEIQATGQAGKEPLKTLRYLKVNRFDVSPQGGRYHMVTANGWLKDPYTFADPYHASYNQLAQLIVKYCYNPERDLKQLLIQVLINDAINNRDDHLRNFTFRLTQEGWELSPAYDLVPSMESGSYPQLMFNNSVVLPSLSQVADAAKAFNLSATVGREIGEQVANALQQWQTLFAECGVSGRDCQRLESVFNLGRMS